MFIPDSPHFIGLFLCNGDDRLEHPYVGSYFKKGGRYVCTGKHAEGETVTSRFELLAAYRAFFLYGATRIVAWVIWVHVLQSEPWDLSWGGPYWVEPFEPW